MVTTDTRTSQDQPDSFILCILEQTGLIFSGQYHTITATVKSDMYTKVGKILVLTTDANHQRQYWSRKTDSI